MEDDFEIIETKFDKDIENLDKSFIDKLKSKKENTEELEKNYKKNLKSIKEEYEEDYSGVLKRKKIFSPEKEEVKKEEEEKKFEGNFKVEKIDFNHSINDQMKSKKEMFLFVGGIKIGKFFKKIIPASLIFFYLDLKLTIKLFFIDAKSFIWAASFNFKKSFINFFKKIGELFVGFFSAIKNGFVFVGSIFKKKDSKKNEDKKDEKKEIENAAVKEGESNAEIKKEEQNSSVSENSSSVKPEEESHEKEKSESD